MFILFERNRWLALMMGAYAMLIGSSLSLGMDKVNRTVTVSKELLEAGKVSPGASLGESGFYEAGRWDFEYDSVSDLALVEQQTHFSVSIDHSHFTLVARVEEPGGQVVANAVSPADAFLRDDYVEVFVRANQDEADFYSILVTAGGVLVGREYGQGGLVRAAWMTSATARVVADEEGWTVQISVPLAELGLDPTLDQWALQVVRKRSPRIEGEPPLVSSWSPSPKTVETPEFFGTLILPEQDWKVFDWEMQGGEVVITQSEEGYRASQTVRVENRTGKEHRVALLSWFQQSPDIVNEQFVTLSPASTEELPVQLALGEKPEIKDHLIHQLVVDQHGGQIVSVGHEWVETRYEPVMLVLREPGYRATIFSTQNLSQIEAELRRTDESLEFEDIQVNLVSKENGASFPGVTDAEKEGVWRVSVPGVEALPEGEWQLEVLVNHEWPVSRRIRKVPYQEGEMWIDRNGVVYRDGKPFPAYGFHYGRPETLIENNDPGLRQNVYFPLVGSQVDLMAGLGEHGVVSGIWSPGPSAASREQEKLTPEDIERYRKIAHTYRNNPNFGFYYLSDEPEINNLSPELMRQINEIYVEEDPWHPTVVTNNTIAGVRAYQEGADISNPDPYPVFRMNRGSSRPFNVAARYLREIRTGEESYRAKWVTPEAFWFYRVGNSRGPSAREMRSQQVLSLIYGALGITWYREQALWDNPGIASSLPYLSEEYLALYPLLVESQPQLVELAENLEAGLVETGDVTVLMITNPLWETRNLTIDRSRLPQVSQWSVLGEMRTLSGTQDLEITLEGHESIVLFSGELALPEGLSWLDVLAAEETLWEASRVAGNIAHYSQGTVIRGVGIPPRIEPGLMAVIDGMKDPRGHGFVMRDFKPGMGFELDFQQDRNPVRINLIGSNLRVGRLQVRQDEEWHTVQEIDEAGEELSFTLSGETLRGIRFIVDRVTGRGTPIRFLEVEVFETQ